jgi:hypothetical protein
MERAVVVGRGLNYANAFEFALKLMETLLCVGRSDSRPPTFCTDPIAMVGPVIPGLSVRSRRRDLARQRTTCFAADSPN